MKNKKNSGEILLGLIEKAKRIKVITIETLEAYRDVKRVQVLGEKRDKFVDGLSVAYGLTLGKLGYCDIDLLNSEFVHNEIERLKKQD